MPPPGTNVRPQWLTRNVGASPAFRIVWETVKSLLCSASSNVRTSCSPVEAQTLEVSVAFSVLSVLETDQLPKNSDGWPPCCLRGPEAMGSRSAG
jgi:hypothetical protein